MPLIFSQRRSCYPIRRSVERRSEVRLNVDRPVRVTGLGACPVHCTGTVRNLSGRGMRLTVPQAIPLGTAVRVDADNVMFLGEICYCVPESSGYSVGLMLEHILTGLDELQRLNRGLFGDSEADGATSDDGAGQEQACSHGKDFRGQEQRLRHEE